MSYENVKEDMTNNATVAGIVCSIPTKSHQIEGEWFYELKVEVERLSKIKDTIPVTISERVLNGLELNLGQYINVTGEYRSYNKLQEEKSKLILHLFAKEIEIIDSEEKKNFINEVRLTGYVCKEPIYRKTPFDREICDILLAVNRVNYHKSDYVPCILWGRNARFMANQTIGCKVEIVGRIQSRDYTKTFQDGKTESKTAYEVSCQRISILANIARISSEQNNQEKKEII